MKKLILFSSLVLLGISNSYSETLNLECLSMSTTKHYLYFKIDTDRSVINDSSSQYPLVITSNEFVWKTPGLTSGVEENKINRYSGVYSRSNSGPGIPVPYKCEVGKTRKF